MTSREIADLTGKPHADLMKAIRTMEEAWVKIGQRNFPLTYYTDQWNRKQPMYELSYHCPILGRPVLRFLTILSKTGLKIRFN